MKNNMKLIMESWRKGLQENNAKQSDGGEILTPSEMQEVEKILKGNQVGRIRINLG